MGDREDRCCRGLGDCELSLTSAAAHPLRRVRDRDPLGAAGAHGVPLSGNQRPAYRAGSHEFEEGERHRRGSLA